MMQRLLYCVSATDLLWYIAVHRFSFVSSVSSATSVVHIDVVFTLCVYVCVCVHGEEKRWWKQIKPSSPKLAKTCSKEE